MSSSEIIGQSIFFDSSLLISSKKLIAVTIIASTGSKLSFMETISTVEEILSTFLSIP